MTMKINTILLLAVFLSINTSFAQNNLSEKKLIPKPITVSNDKGNFELNNETVIYFNSGNETKRLANYLSNILKQ